MYIDLNKNEFCYDDECCVDGICDEVEACDDIEASTDIDAATKTKYDAVRKLLGEDEWYYIEEYILNGDGKHSLEDIIFDEDAWDDYCDWKMQKFHKKAALSAATRIMAKRYLRGC